MRAAFPAIALRQRQQQECEFHCRLRTRIITARTERDRNSDPNRVAHGDRDSVCDADRNLHCDGNRYSDQNGNSDEDGNSNGHYDCDANCNTDVDRFGFADRDHDRYLNPNCHGDFNGIAEPESVADADMWTQFLSDHQSGRHAGLR